MTLPAPRCTLPWISCSCPCIRRDGIAHSACFEPVQMSKVKTRKLCCCRIVRVGQKGGLRCHGTRPICTLADGPVLPCTGVHMGQRCELPAGHGRHRACSRAHAGGRTAAGGSHGGGCRQVPLSCHHCGGVPPHLGLGPRRAFGWVSFLIPPLLPLAPRTACGCRVRVRRWPLCCPPLSSWPLQFTEAPFLG